MNFEELEEKRILILGFGVEGIDSFKFLRSLFPDKIIEIGDKLEFEQLSKEAKELVELDKRKELRLGKDYLQSLARYDIILKSPGIPPKLEEIVKAREEGVSIISQANIFLENCPGTVIGITGTKGKSTTSSLIHKILKKGNLKSHLVGNIGKPVLSLLLESTKEDVYVYELSSHQLALLRVSPNIAVFLNIYPEHLDYYGNLKEYIKAKSNIAKFQGGEDYLVFNEKDIAVKEVVRDSKAKKIPFNSIKLEEIIDLGKVPLKGEFNLQNIRAAIATGQIFGISNEVFEKAVEEFEPLPHRLEFVGEYREIRFYNDALSTIPQAAIGAIDALGKDVQTMMLGGFDRNLQFNELAKKVLMSEIRNVILFPTTGSKIWKAIEEEARRLGIRKLPESFSADNMKDAVKIAYQHTEQGKICLLSTASSSFSIFKDYKEKGNLFKKYVKEFSYKK